MAFDHQGYAKFAEERDAASDYPFGYRTTTDEVLSHYASDLAGKTVFVTGGNAGLGKETARALASAGATVIIGSRSVERGEAAARDIAAGAGPGAADRVSVVQLDLADLASVRACAKAVAAKTPALHVLVANAGIMAAPLGRTTEGFEMQFGVNHVGHFVLARELLPLLVAGASARVVVLSSCAHVISGIDFEDPNFEKRDYDEWVAYGQSKTANALFALEFNRRHRADGVTAVSLHPGGILTDLTRHMPKEAMDGFAALAPVFKTVPQGAATSVFAAVSPLTDEHAGGYAQDCQFITEVDVMSHGGLYGLKQHAADPEAARRLWELTEALVEST